MKNNMGIMPELFGYDYMLPDGIPKKGRVILYGAGKVGRDYYEQLKSNNNYDIVAWVDKNAESYGAKIQNINVIKKYNYDFVLISIKSENIAKSIVFELIDKMGVDNEKIVWRKPNENFLDN